MVLGRSRFFLRKLRLPIRPGERVVDIGSGGDPHPRANVLVDRSVTGGDRTTGFLRSAPTVIADVAHLPFREDAFDFAICSHLLEHVPDPAACAREIGRVAARGYIETPSALHETLMPVTWHKWFVERTEEGLKFTAKPSPGLDQRVKEATMVMWGRDQAFMRWVWASTDKLFVQYLWTGIPRVSVEGVPLWDSPNDEADHDLGAGPVVRGRKRKAYELLALLRYR